MSQVKKKERREPTISLNSKALVSSPERHRELSRSSSSRSQERSFVLPFSLPLRGCGSHYASLRHHSGRAHSFGPSPSRTTSTQSTAPVQHGGRVQRLQPRVGGERVQPASARGVGGGPMALSPALPSTTLPPLNSFVTSPTSSWPRQLRPHRTLSALWKRRQRWAMARGDAGRATSKRLLRRRRWRGAAWHGGGDAA